MAEVRILQDDGKDIIPVTHEDAVLDSNGVKISDKYAKKEDLKNIDLSEINNAIEDLNDKYDELFQSANNGKELIADAIGEPLSSEQTFSAMSNNINGLLSTFKTNMMHNGISVGSRDRFKQLIDKIATMVEEGSNKGIQFASGQIVTDIYTFENTDSTHTFSFNEPLNFTPTYLFIRVPLVRYSSSGSSRNAIVSNLFNGTNDGTGLAKQLHVGSIGSDGVLNIRSVSSSSFVMEGNTNITVSYSSSTGYDSDYYMDWYAIGVGEEDTTLRDSLASILQEEGTTVTEEDDIATLISKTDSTFDSKRQSLYDILISKNLDCSVDESFDDLLSKLMLLDSYLPYKSKIRKISGTAEYFSDYDYTGYRVKFPSDCVTPRFIISTFSQDSTKFIYYYDFTTKYNCFTCNANEGVFMIPPSTFFNPVPNCYDNVVELFIGSSSPLDTVKYILYYDSSDYFSNIEGSSILSSVQGYRDFSNISCYYTTMDKDTFDKLEFLHIASMYSESEYTHANVIYDKNVSNSLLVFDHAIHDYDWGYGYSTVNIIREGNLVYIPVIIYYNDGYHDDIMMQPYLCFMYSKDSAPSGTNTIIDGVLYDYANQIDPCNITDASVQTALDSRYLNNLKHEVSTQHRGLHLGLTSLGSNTGLSLEVAVPLMIDLGIPATTINQYSTCTLTYKAPYYTTVEFRFGFTGSRSSTINEVKYNGTTSGYNNTKTVTFNIANKYSTSNGNLVMYLYVVATQNYPNYNIIEKITFQ